MLKYLNAKVTKQNLNRISTYIAYKIYSSIHNNLFFKGKKNTGNFGRMFACNGCVVVLLLSAGALWHYRISLTNKRMKGNVIL